MATPFVLAVLLVSINMYIPLAVYDDEAKCQAVVEQIDKSTDKFNSEVAVGCITKDEIDRMQKQNTVPAPDDKQMPNGDEELHQAPGEHEL